MFAVSGSTKIEVTYKKVKHKEMKLYLHFLRTNDNDISRIEILLHQPKQEAKNQKHVISMLNIHSHSFILLFEILESE